MDAQQVRENRRVWETIATSFDATRNRPWPTVLQFLETLPAGSRVLDAGCGNARHALPALDAGHNVVGLDVARNLLQAARRNAGGRALGWIEGAVERLPLRTHCFDAVLALAVIHHVRGRGERVAALREWVRVLRPGGRLLVSAWTREQPRFGNANPPRPPRDGRPVEDGDAWVQWTQHGHDQPRFVHLFRAEEFRELAAQAGARVERVWPEAIMTRNVPDNFFALLVRPEAPPESPETY